MRGGRGHGGSDGGAGDDHDGDRRGGGDDAAGWLPSTPLYWPLVVGEQATRPQVITKGVGWQTETYQTVGGAQRAQVMTVDLTHDTTGSVVTRAIGLALKALPRNAAVNMVQSVGNLVDPGTLADALYGRQVLASFGLPSADLAAAVNGELEVVMSLGVQCQRQADASVRDHAPDLAAAQAESEHEQPFHADRRGQLEADVDRAGRLVIR